MKKSFTIITLSLLSFIAVSSTASAQGLVGGFTTLSGVIDSFTGTIIKSLGNLFMGAAIVAFFYGIVQYVWGAREGDKTKITNGNQFMIWGLVALFIMFSVYGIVKFGQNIFGFQDVTSIKIPTIELNRIGNSSPNTATGGSNPLQVSSPNASIGGFGAIGASSNNNYTGGANSLGSGGASYGCTPGYECALSGGGIGLCSSSGTSCESNAINGGTSAPVAGSPLGAGAGCTTDSECNAGLTCQSFTCQK
jgi:hypothetical protein